MTGDLNDPTLYRSPDLAEKLGVGRSFMRRMIAAGFKMPLGRASIAMAHKFLTDHAEVLAPKPGRRVRGAGPVRKRQQPSASGR